jgi:hypothetical protein
MHLRHPERTGVGVHGLQTGHTGNPQKIEALRRMQSPSTRKEVQRLTGRIASLNRFISKAAERSLPFFKVLRANSAFQWGPEQQQAFDDLKKYLEDAAVMTQRSVQYLWKNARKQML